MKEVLNYSKYHWISVIVLICMALSISGSEWIFNKAESQVSFNYILFSRIFPLLCLSFIALLARALQISSYRISWYTTGVIIVLVILLMQSIGLMGYNSLKLSELSIIQAIMFGYIGYWLAHNSYETIWLFNKIAMASVLVSLLIIFDLFIDSEINKSILFPSGHILIFVLYGYCWYLYKWLVAKKKISKDALLLGICSCALWGSFSKPHVFAAIFTTISTFLFVVRSVQNKKFIKKRIIVLLVFTVSFLTLVNYLTQGKILDSAMQIIYSQFLRVEYGTSIGELKSDDLDGAFGGRLDMWQIAKEQIIDSPFFGGGKKTEWAFGATHVHNWFLDMLLWVGIIGFLPFLIGLFWWFKLLTSKTVLRETSEITIPALSYIIALLAYNIGGSIRVFFSVTSFAVLIMAISARSAQDKVNSHLRYQEFSSHLCQNNDIKSN